MSGVVAQQSSGEPGADGASIRIRGTGSINAGQDPLILVDGVEMGIDRVDPNTIETISTLKDAASASIYGARAANGVILITTKRGKGGPVQVTYKGTVTSQSPTNMPNRISVADNMMYTNIAAENNGAAKPVYDSDLIEQYRNFQADQWTRHETDWFNEVVKNSALLTDHTVTVSGGNDNIKFMGTGNYTFQDGLISNSNYERYSIRLNTDIKINSWTRLQVDANLVQANRTQPALSTAKSIINKSLYMLGELPGINADGTYGEGKNGDNPIAVAKEAGEHVTRTPDITVNAQLVLTPVKGLEIIGQVSKRSVSQRDKTFIRGYNYYYQGNLQGSYPPSDASLVEIWNRTVRNYYRAQASYEFNIAEDHAFKILGGFTAEDNNYENIRATKNGFDIPGKEYLSNGSGDALATGGANSWAMASFFARLNYNYKEKYMVELNARWDASSRFAKNQRWGMFPSASLGWMLTKENWMEGVRGVMNMAKIRASYGILGNQNLGTNYPSYATVDSGWSYWFNKELNSGVAITTMSNPDITWEKSKQFNVGVDLGFLNDKITVTGDYFIKKVEDMIMKFPPPYYIGLSPAYTNAANMENKGWEVSISYKGKIRDFKYSATLVLDDVRNKVTDLKGQTYQDKSLMEGYSANGIWGYVTDGYFNTAEELIDAPYFDKENPRLGFVKYVNQNPDEDNVINQDDMVYLGDAYPHYNYGIKLNGEWKGIDLSVFIQGVGQKSVYYNGIGVKPFTQGSALFSHQTDFWTEDNVNAEYPILLPESASGNNFTRSDKWIRNGAYARLKNVELGYTLPQNLTQKMGINNLRFFVSGQNLFTISNYPAGYDPEAGMSGTSGGEFYPIMKTYTFGLDLRF